MDKIIKDLSASTSVNPTTLVEIQHQTESVTKKMTVDNLTKLEQNARSAMDTAIIQGAGLASDGSCAFSGTEYLDAYTNIKGALERLDTLLYSLNNKINVSPVVVLEVELDEQDLTQMFTYPITLLEFGTFQAGASSVYMPISVELILYQSGNALSYGENWYIGYDNGGDPRISTSERIWEVPQAFIENSSGNNVVNIPKYLPGAAAVTGRVSANLIMWSPTSNHGGLTVTSTMKVVIAYKVISVTEATSGN